MARPPAQLIRMCTDGLMGHFRSARHKTLRTFTRKKPRPRKYGMDDDDTMTRVVDDEVENGCPSNRTHTHVLRSECVADYRAHFLLCIIELFITLRACVQQEEQKKMCVVLHTTFYKSRTYASISVDAFATRKKNKLTKFHPGNPDG